ncbi:unnamed protein product, partial [Amoebophrya sp. A120]
KEKEGACILKKASGTGGAKNPACGWPSRRREVAQQYRFSAPISRPYRFGGWASNRSYSKSGGRDAGNFFAF